MAKAGAQMAAMYGGKTSMKKERTASCPQCPLLPAQLAGHDYVDGSGQRLLDFEETGDRRNDDVT
jgi:hypothetical protein